MSIWIYYKQKENCIPSFFTSSGLVKDVTKPEELLSIGLDDSCCGVIAGGGGACWLLYDTWLPCQLGGG